MTAQTKKYLLIGAVGVGAYLLYRQLNKPTVINNPMYPSSPALLPTGVAYNPGPAYTNNTAQIISASAPAITALASQISSWFQKPVNAVPVNSGSAYI